MGPRVPELRLGGHTAIAETGAHGTAEVERSLPAVAPLALQASGEFAGERPDRLAERCHLLTRGVHEVDVFGQWLAERLGHRFDTTVGDKPPTDFRLDLLLQLVGARLVLVTGEALLEIRRGFAVFVLVLFEEPFKDTVEIEVPQRPVQVIRTSDGTAWLHPGVSLHRLAGDPTHHLLIAAHQRLVKHLCEFFRTEILAPTPLLIATSLLIALFVLVDLRQLDRFVANAVLVATEREVHLEDGLEGLPVIVVLHQGRSERVLERLSIFERDVLDRLHRVEILGEADRKTGRAELDDEPVEQVEDRISTLGCRGQQQAGDRHQGVTPSAVATPSAPC